MKLDLDVAGFIRALKSTVKEVSSLSEGILKNKSRLDTHNKSIDKSEKEWKKYAKSIGMSSKQINDLKNVISESNSKITMAMKTNMAYAQSLEKANIRIKTLQSSVGSLTRRVDELTKSTKSGSAANTNFSLTFQDIIRHAQRLIRYYVLMQSAILLMNQSIAVFTEGATFEKSLVTLQGVTRSLNSEIEGTEERIRKLGGTTEWTATQVAEAARFLGMAGLSLQEINTALEGVTSLATAGNIGLAQSADIATNIMTAFGLGVEDLGRVNDVLIGTITRTNSTIEEMSEALKYAAPVGKAFGYEIEEVAAMLGMLHNAGIKGSMAGTNIARAMFKAKDALEKIKPYIGEDQYQGIISGGSKLVDILEAMRGRGFEAADMIKLFGDRGAKAALILQDLNVETTSLKENLERASGETQKLADKMRSTLVVQADLLKSAISEVRLDIFEEQAPKAYRAIKSLTEIVKLLKNTLINLAGILARVAIALKDFLLIFLAFGTVVASIRLFMASIVLLKGLLFAYTAVAYGAATATEVLQLALGSNWIIKGLALLAAGITGIITLYKYLTEEQETLTNSTEVLTEAKKKLREEDQKRIDQLNNVKITKSTTRDAKRSEIYGDYSRETMIYISQEDSAKKYHKMLTKLKDAYVINKTELEQLNLIEKQRGELLSDNVRSYNNFIETQKKLKKEYEELNSKASTYYAGQQKLQQLYMAQEKFYKERASMYKSIFDSSGDDEMRDRAIKNYDLVLKNQVLLKKISLDDMKRMMDAYINTLYKKEFSSFKKQLALEEKETKKHQKKLERLEKKFISSYKNKGGEYGLIASTLQNQIEQSQVKEDILTIDKEIVEINETLIGVDEERLEVLQQRLKTLKEIKKALQEKKDFSDPFDSDSKGVMEEDLEDRLDEILKKEKERIELMEEYNDQLRMAAANIAAMAVEGAGFDDIMKAALTALGQYVGSAIGSAYGGPAGGAVGGAIGGAIGSKIGDIFSNAESASGKLEDEFNRLTLSMQAFDESIRRSNLTDEQKAEEYTKGARRIAEIEKEIMDLRRTTKNGQLNPMGFALNYQRLMKELNATTANIEEFRQALRNAAEAAIDSRESMLEDRKKYFRDRLREETWDSSDWSKLLKEQKNSSSVTENLIKTLKDRQSNLEKDSALWRELQAEIDVLEIKLTDQTEEWIETERELIASLESSVEAMKNLETSFQSVKESLLEGAYNPDQSFKWAEQHYNELREKALASGSREDMENYRNYLSIFLEKARKQYGSTADYAEIFEQILNTDIPSVEEELRKAIEENTKALKESTEKYLPPPTTRTPPSVLLPPSDPNDPNNPYYSALPNYSSMSQNNFSTQKPQPSTLQNSNSEVVNLLSKLLVATQNRSNIGIEIDGGQLDYRIRRESDKVRVDADNFGYEGRRMIQ